MNEMPVEPTTEAPVPTNRVDFELAMRLYPQIMPSNDPVWMPLARFASLKEATLMTTAMVQLHLN